MPITKSFVTADSSDQEIIDAINAAGEHRHHWRKHDWSKEPGSNNTRSWVIPHDIGRSTRKDTSLLLRLRQMVRAGLLEERSYGARMMPIRNYPCADSYICCRGMPRFRAIVQ